MSSQDLPARVRLTLASKNKSAVSIVITASEADHTFAIGREDYTEDTLEIANAQAVGVTEEAKNRYGLSIGSSTRSLQNNGKPAPIEDGGPGGRNTFSDEFRENGSSEALSVFENLSNSELHDFNVIKGKASQVSDKDRDYVTQVLADVNQNGSNSAMALSADRIAGENNVYSTTKPYLTSGQLEKDTRIGTVTEQAEFGVHGPRTYPNSKTVSEVPLQSLKNLGIQLLLKSAGEWVIPSNSEDFVEVLAARGASFAPGLARLGLKIPVGSMEPGRILREANPNYSKPTNPTLSGDELLSHGSYNNPLAPFDAVDSRSSVAAAVILVATITGIFEALSRVFDPKNGLQSPLANGVLGSINSTAFNTRNDYSECVREGLRLFFGGGSSPGDFTGIVLDGASKFNDSPGYYNTILRSLTKMITYEIGQAAFSAVVPPGVLPGNTGPISSNSGLEIQQPGLSRDITVNLLNSVRRMTQSRIVGFMNVMATMGEISISRRAAGDLGDLANLQVVQTSDRIEATLDGNSDKLNMAALVYKDRISNNNKAMAWTGKSTLSAYILPRSIELAEANLGGENGIISRLSSLNMKNETDQKGVRIKPEVVEEIEKELDASYVPFYFHDLRTNEIISFHAFLEDMSDTFNAEYGETSGYGRIGKVYTYKNTDRTISLGFSAVATSPQDFDEMWWKINKLVTLVYPQYTAGRTIEHEGQKFIQPFSQLPSASPMIRLRLGDVLKSNYSKFNLARLFGLGQSPQSFSLSQGVTDEYNKQIEEARSLVRDARTRMRRNEFNVGERFTVNHTAIRAVGGARSAVANRVLVGTEWPAQSYVLQRKASQSQTTPAPTASPAGSSGRGARAAAAERATLEATLVSGPYLMRVVSVDGPDDGDRLYTLSMEGGPPGTADAQFQIRLPRIADDSSAESPTVRSAITIYEPDVQAAAARAATPSTSGSEENSSVAVQDFFKSDVNADDANPIFKAFESTKGKGLAGFIKSIKFDWNEAPWETNGLNNRAPQMCKINIDFAPIHDISPGLDSNGFSTAPVYRIGAPSNATSNAVHEDARKFQTETEHYATRAGMINRKPPTER